MNAKDIAGRKFDKSFNGYKPDDVDDFLRDVSSEFSQLQKDNRDLEKKLEVLADKIREYRNDEDALKEALLGAQKQGQAAIAEAKEKAKGLVEDAENKADTILADARAESEKLKKEADENLRNANDEADRVKRESDDKYNKMEAEYKAQVDLNKEILHKTKTEVVRFRQKIMEDFTRATGIIEALPESCESQFVSKTLNDYQKERNVTLKKPAMKPAPIPSAPVPPKPPEKPVITNNLNLGGESVIPVDDDNEHGEEADTLFEEFAAQMIEEKKSTSFEVKLEADKLFTDLTTEINFEPVFEEEAGESAELDATAEIKLPKAAKGASKDDAEAEDEKDEDDSIKGEPENIFFKKGNNASKDREPLEFGGAKGKGKK
jgi:DivIVA domain-containing protein